MLRLRQNRHHIHSAIRVRSRLLSLRDGILSSKSISLILSLSIIAFMITFVADLIVTSHVAHRITMNFQDSSRAEMLAKSGQNLGAFLLAIDYGLDLTMKETVKQPLTDSTGDIWTMLNEIPFGGEESNMLTMIVDMFGLSDFNHRDVIQKLRDLGGSFTLHTEDETSRINLSMLQSSRMGSEVIRALNLLFSCPVEQRFLEDKGYSADEMAYRVFDFIDIDKKVRVQSGLSSENGPYEKNDPPYKAINHPLESVDQIRLVTGWDYQIHAVFSPFITVFPIPNQYSNFTRGELAKKPFLNINTVSRELLQCLFPEMTTDCYENFVRTFTADQEARKVMASNKLGVEKFLGESLCYEKQDDEDRSRWFGVASNTFRIKSVGKSGDTQKVIESVIQRLSPQFMKTNKRGTAYDVLYWKNHSG
ncbi:MAG: type II secretion system protein GspK [Proteobacteria bacterium]|nr:type II secretion system protein GspK [Pseudomonadota bacterium]